MKHFMQIFPRTFITATISLLLLLVGCDKLVRGELDALQDQIDALADRVDQLNASVNSLGEIVREIQNGGYVETCVEVVEGGKTIGWRLTFSDGKEIIIYNGKDGANGSDGNDGHTPLIGVRQDTDGLWYWTLDGEWLTDANGSRVRASGIDGQNGQDGENGKDAIAPQLKIENDYWYISTDGGQTWTRLGKAKGEDGKNGQNGNDGHDGDSFFSGVDLSDPSKVVLILADGTRINLNRYMAASLRIDVPGEIMIASKETLTLDYTIEGTISEGTFVTASSDGIYRVRVSKTNSRSGKIIVTCPDEYSDGYVNVLLSDGYGYTKIRVLNFFERKMTLSDGLDYTIAFDGGALNIPVCYNFDYTLQVSADAADWVEIIQTKASMQNGTIRVSIAPNHTQIIRRGQIKVSPMDNQGFVYQTINIIQTTETVVDLGLSVKWATRNLCESGFVNAPLDHGDYYAWGEAEPKWDDYSWSTYKFCTSGDMWDNVKFSKYNTSSSYGTVDNKTVLDPEDDVAYIVLGGYWRMPTRSEWDELSAQCSCSPVHGGYKVMAPNDGGYIYLPCPSRKMEYGIDDFNYGLYWSSSLCPDEPYRAWAFCFDGNPLPDEHTYTWISFYERSNGLQVRPVYDDRTHPQSVSLNKSSLSLIEGLSEQLTLKGE